VAKKRGYKVIATDQVYLYSKDDLTEEVMKELDK
jgi:Skp family chaperone for outer membrane proteins